MTASGSLRDLRLVLAALWAMKIEIAAATLLVGGLDTALRLHESPTVSIQRYPAWMTAGTPMRTPEQEPRLILKLSHVLTRIETAKVVGTPMSTAIEWPPEK